MHPKPTRQLIRDLRNLSHLSETTISAINSMPCYTVVSRYSTDIYVRSIYQIISLLHLLSDKEDALRLNCHAITSLARDIIETHEMFYYLCVEKVPRGERDFRMALFDYHGMCERTRIATYLGYQGVDDGMYRHSKELSRDRLTGNPFFSQLHPRDQAELLKGKNAFHRLRNRQEYPKNWTKDKRNGVYALLSNSIHATWLGTRSGVGLSQDLLTGYHRTLQLALLASVHYFASLTIMFFNKRTKLRQFINPELLIESYSVQNNGYHQNF